MNQPSKPLEQRDFLVITFKAVKNRVVLGWKDLTFWLIKWICKALGRPNTYYPYKMSERPYLRRFNATWDDSRAGRGFSRSYHVSSKNRNANETEGKHQLMSERSYLETLDIEVDWRPARKGFTRISHKSSTKISETLWSAEHYEIPDLPDHRAILLPQAIRDAVARDKR